MREISTTREDTVELLLSNLQPVPQELLFYSSPSGRDQYKSFKIEVENRKIVPKVTRNSKSSNLSQKKVTR